MPPKRQARTREEREQNLINAAMDLVEERIKNGTATSPEIVHFLKLGTTREEMERVKMEAETRLLQAKVEAAASMANIETLYAEAIQAMKRYSGASEDEDLS